MTYRNVEVYALSDKQSTAGGVSDKRLGNNDSFQLRFSLLFMLV